MPHVSIRQVRRDLKRRRGTDRYRSALLVVEEPDGREVVRAGGLWDCRLHRYADPVEAGVPLVARRARLQVAQVPLMRGLARWLAAARRGDPSRVPAILAAGNRGSSKTFGLAGIFVHIVALEWPGDEQFVVNLNSDNRRECQEHLGQVGDPSWIKFESTDLRDLHTEWITGARVNWVSAQNPKKLQQGGLPVRHVLLNEAHLMSEFIGAKAQGLGRNLGALLSCTFNPPTSDGGNWSARLWFAIKAGEGEGECYLLHNRDNAEVDHVYLDKAGKNIRVISPLIAAADVDGEMKLAGPIAYRTFDGRPYNHADPAEGGHVGEPPQLGWADITRQVTAEDLGGQTGADVVISCDFQRSPGIIGNVCKIYRASTGEVILYVERQVASKGIEVDFSQALIDAGYSTNGFHPRGHRAPLALLLGDATGARQNASHRFHLPTSFVALKSDGWVVVPPMRHWKHGTPWNPDVKTSVAQMHGAFERHWILLGPACREVPQQGFPSLVDSFRNAKRYESGKLREEGNFQHGPDGVRYAAWRYLPRPQLPVPQGMDPATFDAFGKLRLR